jgi:hypothetical protein
MGMDVWGRKPKNEQGEYFRANIWSWHPIWDYTAWLEPKICAKVKHAHSNDGDGLNEHNSIIVGKAVLASIKDGKAARYVKERDAEIATLPLEICIHCHGTGTRQEYENKDGETFPMWDYNVGQTVFRIEDLSPRKKNPKRKGWKETSFTCDVCQGTGKVKNWISNYSFELDHLEEWGNFLLNCGGFNIH